LSSSRKTIPIFGSPPGPATTLVSGSSSASTISSSSVSAYKKKKNVSGELQIIQLQLLICRKCNQYMFYAKLAENENN
jgi:hypothetical protein